MKKKIVLIIAVVLLLSLVAATCFACKTKDVTVDDLGGKTYKFFSFNSGFSLYDYDFVFTYGIGEERSSYTFTEDTIVVEFNKDGSTGVCHYNYKNANEIYNFTYTVNEKDANKIDIQIPSENLKTSATLMKDFIVLDTDDIIGDGTNVYLRLE